MPIEPVQVVLAAGLTGLTAKVYPETTPATQAGADYAVSVVQGMTYEFSIPDEDALTGLHWVKIENTGGVEIASGWATLANETDTVYASSDKPIESGGGGFTSDDRDDLAAVKSRTDLIKPNSITVVSPVVKSGTTELVVGDSYLFAQGRALRYFSDVADEWVGITIETPVKLFIDIGDKVLEFDAEVITATGTQEVRVELTHAQSATIKAGLHNYALTLNPGAAEAATIAHGKFRVLPQIVVA